MNGAAGTGEADGVGSADGKGTGDGALRELIRRAGGSVSVEEFMRLALYDAEVGYYARRVQTVGRTGDFSTAATLHPALGQAFAAWAAAHRAEVAGRDGWWHVIELGGGNGEMAATVLGSLGWWGRRRLRYHVVEVSAGLCAAQERRLGRWGGQVAWHAEMADAVRAADGRALVFSNEFVDAFPCVALEWGGEGDGWREVRVAWADGVGPVEEKAAWVPPVVCAPEEISGVLDPAYAAGLKVGQRVEVHLSYRRWLREWLPQWVRGRMLTIDYGDELLALYHRRPRGTLRAYCRQIRFEGAEIYRRFGQQDITADVNFSDLRAWGEAEGLETDGYGTQAEFLRRGVPAKTLGRAGKEPALAYLLDAEGPGGAFKVLEQRRISGSQRGRSGSPSRP